MKKIICTFLMTTLFIQISFSTTYAANSQNDESACTDLLGYCLDTVLQDPEPITSIMSTDGLNLVQFLYDSNGQRISKSYMGQVTYYFYNENYRNERDDCIQDVVIRCVKNLDSYRPDKGMLVRSYLSLIIKRAISSILVSQKRKLIKEKII